LQTLFVDDAGALFKQIERAFGDITKDLRKPNVLLTGITGAGKSSLINAVFGKQLAATGTGVPITQHFT
jgi:predicted GTPase